MKVRSGFVSNSSTSSFVIAGFVLPKKQWTNEKIFKALRPDEEYDEDNWYEYFNGNDDDDPIVQDDGDGGAPRGKVLVGYKVVSFSSEDGSCTECDLDIDQLKERCRKLGDELGLPKSEKIKLVGGTEAC